MRFATDVATHCKAGRLVALGVTSAKRSTAMPDVPTLAESGYPSFDLAAWCALFAPAGTPPATIAMVQRAGVAALEQADLRDAIVTNGARPVGTTPAEFAAMIDATMARWAPVMRSLFPAPATSATKS
jgi:tripartite-type tricarboxylate transporter receptor subunit TctC